MIGHRDAEHFGGDDRRKRLGKIGQQVHPAVAARLDVVDQAGGDFFDMLAQHPHARGREGKPRELSQAGVGRGIHEEHLLHHHLGDGRNFGRAQRLEILR